MNRGRPKIINARTKVFALRFSPAEFELVDRAARLDAENKGMGDVSRNRNNFVVQAALSRAESVLKDSAAPR